MNRKEVMGVLTVLKTAYPNFYRNVSPEEARQVVNLWLDLFADDPADQVGLAVKALIASDKKGFPPHIGAVKETMRQLSAPARLTEQEAWSLVSRACAQGIYHAREEFDKLPPEVQRVVGSPNQLREWAVMDAATVQSVVASNFQRSYRARAAQREQWEALPAGVRALAGPLGERLALKKPSPQQGEG